MDRGSYKKFPYNPLKTKMLADLRRAVKLPQIEAGAWVGLTGKKRRDSVSNWENGISRPDPTRRLDFIVYLRDGLRLCKAPERLLEVWNEVMVGEWGWDPLTEEELRCNLFDQERPPVAIPLPARTTPFIGRETQLDKVCNLLASPKVRLLTLTGPGGMGKTRLAVEAAWQLLSTSASTRYPDGIFFVSLAPLRSIDTVVPTIAQVLGFSFGGGPDPRQQVADYPRQKQMLLDYLRQKQMLLILDNFEHLSAGGELVVEMLHAAPGLQLLVTSRERLELQVEYVFELEGISYPPEGENALEHLSHYSAVALFLSVAQRVRPNWVPQDEDWAHIAHLCGQVQGMPLALLLAAAWVDTFSPADISRHVAQDLGFLKVEWRDLPERQRSIRAVCDASWRRLTAREKAAFAALTVYRGGFTAEAAQAVGRADLHTLHRLVHKSFLQVAPPTVDTGLGTRYDMHELLRQYGLEKLEQSPDGGKGARDRHAAYYLKLLERRAAESKGPRQQDALSMLALELDNLRTAWAWIVEQARWAEVEKYAEPLARFHDARWRGDQAHSLFRQAVERLSPFVDEEAKAAQPATIFALIELLAWQGRFEPDDLVYEQLAKRCLKLLDGEALTEQDARRLEAKKALVLYVFARILASVKTDYATGWLQENVPLYHALDNRWTKTDALFAESITLHHTLGDHWTAANVQHFRGGLAWDMGELRNAMRHYRESLDRFRALGDERGIAANLHGLHEVYGYLERFEDAQDVVDERMELANARDDPASHTLAHEMKGSLAYIKGNFNESVNEFKRCVSLAETVIERTQLAYLSARLGHAMLHIGDYGAGLKSAARSLDLGREMHHRRAIRVALLVLARHALLEERYKEACERYKETFQLYEETMGADVRIEAGYRQLSIFYEGEWAAAELLQDRKDEARRHLCLALHAAAGEQTGMMPIRVLPSVALWLTLAGNVERAKEVYALAVSYPHIANSRWYQDVFGQRISAEKGTLSQEVVEVAQARDLKLTIQELLAELSE